MNLKIKAILDSDVMVTYASRSISYVDLFEQIRDLWSFDKNQKFTMKFIDDEGDPCMLSCPDEFEEAIRTTCDQGRNAELTIHVFPGVPSAAGQPCPGEDSKFCVFVLHL